MKFQALFFIRMAQRNGIILTKIEGNIRVTGAPPWWLSIIKKHKRELLKHLPDDEVKRMQLDLFDDQE